MKQGEDSTRCRASAGEVETIGRRIESASFKRRVASGRLRWRLPFLLKEGDERGHDPTGPNGLATWASSREKGRRPKEKNRPKTMIG
jgi:hypothetical protein